MRASTVTRRSLSLRLRRTSKRTRPAPSSRIFSTCSALLRAPVSIFARSRRMRHAGMSTYSVTPMTSGTAALRVTPRDATTTRRRAEKPRKVHQSAPLENCVRILTVPGLRKRGQPMPDEFPTLEAVAALGVLALLIRTLLIGSEMQSVPRLAAELVRALAVGDRGRALSACNAPAAPALARSAREMIALVGEPPYGPDATLDLNQEQRELEQDLARRAESGRARDLIVLTVLIGAMAFAVLSNLLVTSWFHSLAAFASLLVIIGYVMRSRLRRIERTELSRIGDALQRMLSAAPGPHNARRSLHSIDGGCRACGETVFLVAHDSALGASLPALGIHELRICKNCGFVSGQAEDRAALAAGALEELSVPFSPDDEASSDDTEHDG